MFKTKTTPVPGAQLKTTIDSIEEMWREFDSKGANAETAQSLHRDLFEMVGACKGLMMALELATPYQEEAENDA